MDWLVLSLLCSFLVLCIVLIGFTLISLLNLGDERKKYIQMKAQSYAFAVVIGMLLLELGESIYFSFWGNGEYSGISPFTFLIAICTVYLMTLLIYKRKYGN